MFCLQHFASLNEIASYRCKGDLLSTKLPFLSPIIKLKSLEKMQNGHWGCSIFRASLLQGSETAASGFFIFLISSKVDMQVKIIFKLLKGLVVFFFLFANLSFGILVIGACLSNIYYTLFLQWA